MLTSISYIVKIGYKYHGRVVGQFHVNSPGVAQLINHRRNVNSKLAHYLIMYLVAL